MGFSSVSLRFKSNLRISFARIISPPEAIFFQKVTETLEFQNFWRKIPRNVENLEVLKNLFKKTAAKLSKLI